MAQQLWVTSGDKVVGPFTSEQLRDLAANGKLKREYKVSRDRENWVPATSVKGLSFLAEETDTPAPASQSDSVAGMAGVDSVTAAASAPMMPVQFLLASLIAIAYAVLQLIGSAVGGLVGFRYINDHSDHYDTFLRYLFLFAGAGIGGISFTLGALGFGIWILRAQEGRVLDRAGGMIGLGVFSLLSWIGLAIAFDAPSQVWPGIILLCVAAGGLIIAGIIMISGRKSYDQWRQAVGSRKTSNQAEAAHASSSEKEQKPTVARSLGRALGAALKGKAKGPRDAN